MKKTIVLLALFITACATMPVKIEKKVISDELISRSDGKSLSDPRPDWIIKEKEPEKGKIFFLGISDKLATEKDARDDAYNNAIKKVAGYIGIDVKVKIEKLVESYGLSDKIINPSVVSKAFEEQQINAFVNRVKQNQWYIEKRKEVYNTKESRIYYLAYLLVSVPEDDVNQRINELIELKKKEAEFAKLTYSNVKKAVQLFGERDGGFNINLWANKPSGSGYKSGESITFHFTTEKDCYLYLFHIDTEGYLRMLFPNKWNTDNRVKAGIDYKIPDDNMDFDFKVIAPYGSEVLIAFATDKPIESIDIDNEKGFKTFGKIDSIEAEKLSMILNTKPVKTTKILVVNTYE